MDPREKNIATAPGCVRMFSPTEGLVVAYLAAGIARLNIPFKIIRVEPRLSKNLGREFFEFEFPAEFRGQVSNLAVEHAWVTTHHTFDVQWCEIHPMGYCTHKKVGSP